jgi:putative iron-regulated protein
MALHTKRLNLAVFCTLALAACGESEDATVSKQAVVEQYSALVYASMTDSVTAAEALRDSVSELVEDPSQATLDAARGAWKAAREPYLQTEVYRFYKGPIDEVEGMINAWPLDEVYIDYVEGMPDSGIVNDPEATIDADSLMALNEQGAEENIATGFHAIEFLLWGQDFDADGPGQRPYTDYVTEGEGASPSAERRSQYLRVVTELLIEHLSEVTDAWSPNDDGNYRHDFEAGDPDSALASILTGMYTLSGFETGGERLQNALISADQNDEHSCFSDNTHRDMIGDVQGVLNVWRGSYKTLAGKTVSGPGIGALVESMDAELFADLDKQIKGSLSKAKALQPPFDQEITEENTEGRERVDALVQTLREQEQLIDRVATLLDVEFVPQE